MVSNRFLKHRLYRKGVGDAKTNGWGHTECTMNGKSGCVVAMESDEESLDLLEDF